MANRESDYITEARQHARNLWDAVYALKALQAEWNAKDYSGTHKEDPDDPESEDLPNLPDGVGENEGYTKARVSSVVFDTTEAILTLFASGHATNVANLL